ncbi:DUF1674 domain-containing protein [Sphingomonas alpina]|uniref:DUF1674 domain-containing protein n=1 Tax=Sphingomonas alpina TaxID=653931 RepID=A0A7H0LHG5_9SPHN|nr:DUF1674 domain-containing protein [Sphingomonas alpina]QNQ09118.1 DUF1674 domain-containing protein [Sphingomonas alpina]
MAQRPPHVKPPAYLSKNPPVPAPDPKENAQSRADDPPADPLGLNPVRYGDWELKGVAVDF